MKKYYIILILFSVALNYSSYSSNKYLNENEGIINRKNNKSPSNNLNKSKFETIKYYNDYNISENYLLFCKDQKKNVDLGVIESTLKPLIDCKQDFMFNALYKLSIPRNYADKFYNYFRSKALQEQQEAEIKNTDTTNTSEETNSPKQLADHKKLNQDDVSDDESVEEVKVAASGAGSTPPDDNNDGLDIQAPRILSRTELLAKEEELREDIINTRDVDKAHEYIIFFNTNKDQLEERKDKLKYVFTAVNAHLGMINHIYPQFTSKKYTNILKMYHAYYSHNGKIEIQIKNKHGQKGFIKLIIKHCDEEGKQLGKQFNFIKKSNK